MALAKNLFESIWHTALGLLLCITSLVTYYQYLFDRLRRSDHDMEEVSLGFTAPLSRERDAIEGASDRRKFGENFFAELAHDKKFFRRSVVLAGALLLMAWFIQVARYFDDYERSLHSIVQSATIYVLFTFGLSCLVASSVWIKQLRRRRGGLVALSSVFYLCWSVAEFVVGRHAP